MLNAQITAHVPQPLSASATATVAATLTATDSHPRTRTHTHTLDTHTHAHTMGVSALQPGSLLPLTANKCFDIYCQPDSQTLFTSRYSLLSTPLPPFLLPTSLLHLLLLLATSLQLHLKSGVCRSALCSSIVSVIYVGTGRARFRCGQIAQRVMLSPPHTRTHTQINYCRVNRIQSGLRLTIVKLDTICGTHA